MTVLTVLENETELFAARDLIAEILPDADLLCFGNSLPALAAARSREIDVAILDMNVEYVWNHEMSQATSPAKKIAIVYDGWERDMQP